MNEPPGVASSVKNASRGQYRVAAGARDDAVDEDVVRRIRVGVVGRQRPRRNVDGAVGADIGDDVFADRGRRVVGAVDGDGDVLRGRGAVVVGHRDEVVLGQHLALRQELDVGIVDREVPADRAAAAGFAHRIERERADVIVGQRRETRRMGVRRLDVREGDVSGRALGRRTGRGIDRDLVDEQAGAVV